VGSPFKGNYCPDAMDMTVGRAGVDIAGLRGCPRTRVLGRGKGIARGFFPLGLEDQ